MSPRTHPSSLTTDHSSLITSPPSPRCTYLKPNGQQCRGHALWGSNPPRCAVHRQDGGPPSPFRHGHQYARLTVKHGYHSRPLCPPQNMADEAAEILLKHERLSACLENQNEPVALRLLYRLYGRNLNHLVALLEHFHQRTGHHPDRLLQAANGEPRTKRWAALNQILHKLKNETVPTSETTSIRSPRYWLVYNYIVAHIGQTGVSPTRRQLKRACGISSNNVVDYWLDKLAQDRRIIRHPGQARAISLPADLAPPPIQPELPF